MTPLGQILAQRIRATGPITVADYMAECLLHPTHGYYTTQPPFGAGGDFITAPEISQMFGEVIGLCLAQAWMDQGQPAFTLAELGPGRGTLMADMLRAAARVPGFTDAAQVCLIEASAALRAEQRHTLSGLNVAWVDSVTDLPEAPLFLVANEFFDALPIRQFQRGTDGWQERLVIWSEDRLAFGLAPSTPHPPLAHRLEDTAPGDVVETCAPATAILEEVSQKVAQHGGAALVVDYGGWRSTGDTLQAVARHAPTDPLAEPGQADVTAHVDFEALTRTARRCQVSAMTPQGVFLERLGITARAQALARKLSGAALEQHITAHRRLTHPEEMGTLFKVIGLTPFGAPALPGLTP